MYKFVAKIVLFTTFFGLSANSQYVRERKTVPSLGINECPKSDQTQEKISIRSDTNTDITTPFEDPNRDLKDIGTQFVVKEFFKSKDTLYHFLKLIITSFDAMLMSYREANNLDENALFFIFKGGNVLRIFAKEILAMLPLEPRQLLEQTYGDYIKRSDSDFSIFVDPNKLSGLDYETVMREVSEQAYKTLGTIRDELSAHKEKYFSFFQLKRGLADSELEHYLSSLSDLEAVGDPNNSKWYQAKFKQLQLLDEAAKPENACSYQGQFDYLYDFDSKDPNIVIGKPLTNKSHWIMNSVNRTLEWPIADRPDKVIKFYLVRSKIQFEYTFTKDGILTRKPIGGELIDVSMPHKGDFTLANFLAHKNEWVADYELMLKPEESFNFKAESPEGLAHELHEIVFNQSSRPWKAVKYEKRLMRLGFFGIVDSLTAYGVGSTEVKTYVERVVENLFSPAENFQSLGADQKREFVQRMAQEVENITQDYLSMKHFNKIWYSVIKLVQTMIDDPSDEDPKNYKEFVEIIKTNLRTLMSLTEMQSYKITTDGVFKAKMDSLL